MIRILNDRRRALMLVPALVCCVLLAGSLHARGARATFEQAYALEKEDPAGAIELYEEALRAGLGTELAKAARWRLFYLHRDQKNYGRALNISSSLGSDKKLKNVLGDLYDEIAVHWKISRFAAEQYAAGLRLLDAGKSAEAVKYFGKALKNNVRNEAFRRDITERLLRERRFSDALALFESLDHPAARLARADVLVKLKRREEARVLLLALARENTSDPEKVSENPGQKPQPAPVSQLSDADRAHILYLLARIHRDGGDRVSAVRYFRLAARYSDDVGAVRMNGLAAFSLYRDDHKPQALEILRNLPGVESDANVRLLYLILRVEIDRDGPAFQSLRNMQGDLIEQQRTGSASYLTDRALKLLARGAP